MAAGRSECSLRLPIALHRDAENFFKEFQEVEFRQ